MAKFFGFYNEQEHCYTTINIDKIIVVNKKTGTIKDSDNNWFKTITQAQILVEVGEDVKEYIIEEDQYNRLMDCIKRINVLNSR
jgi:hypothetical protein